MTQKNITTLAFVAGVLTATALLIGQVAGASSTISGNISTGGTLSVTGASTFTDAVYASSTLAVTGDVFTYGLGTFGNSATADQYVFTGGLQASSTAGFGGVTSFYGNLVVDKAATTTVTFNQAGINFDANTFVIDPNSNRLGILTATPKTALEVVGTASTSALISSGALVASTTLGVTGQANFYGSVGLGTSSPATTLAVVGTTTTGGLVVGSTGNPINTILMGTCTYNPGAAITASTTLSTNCTSATGVRSGDRVFVTPRSLANHLVMTSASSTATDDVIQVAVYNEGWGGPLTPASATWSWMAIR